MIVAVSDTSPLRYLILVEQVDALPQLFDQVLVPPAVLLELSQSRAPEPVRLWAASPPTWLSIREPAHIDHSLNLGAGEEAAVALAREVQATMVLIDDRDAVRAARARGLTVVGTLALWRKPPSADSSPTSLGPWNGSPTTPISASARRPIRFSETCFSGIRNVSETGSRSQMRA